MIIESRFNGPAGSGNGGYTAGLVAARLDGAAAVEVTLRAPPPLETPLRVAGAGAGIEVYAGERLVAAAAPVAADALGEPPPHVGFAEAAGASQAYPGFVDHPFPTCYVCGPRRPAGDGLGIYPGPVGPGRTAAVWRVPEGVSPPTVWAALDCPGGWAIIGPGRPYLLGRIAAQVRRVPAAGSRCVVTGALVSTEGRKALVRTALYTADGELLAVARAIWIAIREDAPGPVGDAAGRAKPASSERPAGTQPSGV